MAHKCTYTANAVETHIMRHKCRLMSGVRIRMNVEVIRYDGMEKV